MQKIIFGILVLLALVGCDIQNEYLDQPFNIVYSEAVRIEDAGVILGFSGVEDNRCPKNTVCPALVKSIDLSFQVYSENEFKTIEFSYSGASISKRVDGFFYTLEHLEKPPYPTATKKQYVALVTVTAAVDHQ